MFAFTFLPFKKSTISKISSIAALLLSIPLHALEVPTVDDPAFWGANRKGALEAFPDPLLSGSLPTFYTPGNKARAKSLQKLIGGETEFYHQQFQIDFPPITLAVIDEKQWPQVSGKLPYGVPSMYRGVFIMPAEWQTVTTVPFPHKSDLDPATLKQALAHGRKWKDLEFRGGDGIGTHEIGHVVFRLLEIDPQVKWFREFLASYIGYSYLKAKRPKEVIANEIFWRAGLKTPHPHTSLDYFESQYSELTSKEPNNYAWYQFALDQRLLEIYQQQGIDFLRKVRTAFPKGGPKLDTDQVIDTLETISPGWKRWKEQIDTGNVHPAPLPDLQ
ncbi:hypothetical protein [Granulicella sp. S190]|uniref:hypothetical protein n=1 Tax=Granulicella sp. S190 TaxID=1747226 RepID=UPI00131C18A0|nr:hypothetical protein [Granulicella sp. S190]